MKRKIARSLVTLMLLVALVAAGAFLYRRMQIQAEADQAREMALEKAVEIARFYGMATEQPDVFVMKQTTLAEWFAITQSTGSSDPRFGLNSDRSIWIVSMIITGTFSGPGVPGMTRPQIDNISMAIAADTFKEIGIHIADVTQPLPLGLERP